jgi:hypothetical protein
MPLYRTLSSVPELAPLSEDERRRVWKLVRGRLARSWKFWAVGLVGGLAAGIIDALLLDLIPSRPLRLLADLCLIGVFFLVWERAALALARPYIREVLVFGHSDRSG